MGRFQPLYGPAAQGCTSHGGSGRSCHLLLLSPQAPGWGWCHCAAGSACLCCCWVQIPQLQPRRVPREGGSPRCQAEHGKVLHSNHETAARRWGCVAADAQADAGDGGSRRGTEHAHVLHRAPSPPPLALVCNMTSSAAENTGDEITRYKSRPGRLGNHYFLLFFIACVKKPGQEPRCEAASCRAWRLCWGRESRDLSAPPLPLSCPSNLTWPCGESGTRSSSPVTEALRSWLLHQPLSHLHSLSSPSPGALLAVGNVLVTPNTYMASFLCDLPGSAFSSEAKPKSRATCDESPAPAPSLPPPR